MSDTFLASGYVYGAYNAYVPLYAYTLLRAYEEARVRIHVHGHFNGGPLRAYWKVAERYPGRCAVVPCAARLYPWRERAGFKTAFRYLLGREHFAGHRYGLNADTDVLIIRETPSLLEQEVERCRALGAPYSGVARTAPEHRRKMAGWLFHENAPFFDAVQPQIERARADPEWAVPKPDPENAANTYDEGLLYRLIKDAGLKVHEHDDETRPYTYVLEHGFHLGMRRVGFPYPEWWRQSPAWRAEGLALFADPFFQSLRRALGSPFVEGQLAALESFLNGAVAVR